MCARLPPPLENRPTREQAEEAVRTLIAFAGDNPAREGVLETPKRVVEAYEEMFRGYTECPADVLDKTFAESEAYDDFVLVRDITFNSHCEHHMMPFFGKAHIAYRPVDRVVGPVEARAPGRCLCASPADAGAYDRADRRPRSTRS